MTFAISKISDPWSPRQQRHLAYVSEFTTDVRHIEGKANTVADTHLSLAWTIRRWQQHSVQTRVSQPSRQPPLNLSSGTYRWTITATRSCVTYPLADPDHSSQTRGNAPCLILYTASPTRQSEQQNNWSRLSLYGLAYGSKSASGRNLSSLSSGQGTSTHYRPRGPGCACDTPFRSHPRRHSGPSATVTELSIPTHSGRQVHPMAGSDSTC